MIPNLKMSKQVTNYLLNEPASSSLFYWMDKIHVIKFKDF